MDDTFTTLDEHQGTILLAGQAINSFDQSLQALVVGGDDVDIDADDDDVGGGVDDQLAFPLPSTGLTQQESLGGASLSSKFSTQSMAAARAATTVAASGMSGLANVITKTAQLVRSNDTVSEIQPSAELVLMAAKNDTELQTLVRQANRDEADKQKAERESLKKSRSLQNLMLPRRREYVKHPKCSGFVKIA